MQNQNERHFPLNTQTKSLLVTFLLIATFLIPYFIITLPRLTLPGPHFDEILAIWPLLGYFHQLNIGSFHFPLDMVGYNGAMESYVVAPFVKIFGPTINALRICSILFGALTLIAIFFICYNFFHDRRVAWGSAFFLATLSAYVTGTKLGIYSGIIPLFFQTMVLLCLFIFLQKKKMHYFYLSCFLQGVALGGHSSILFSIMALWISNVFILKAPFQQILLGCSRDAKLSAGHSPKCAHLLGWAYLHKLFLCIVLLIVGAFPFSLYLTLHGKYFFSTVYNRFSATSSGYDNSNYIDNLKFRYKQLINLWSNDLFLWQAFPDRAKDPQFGKREIRGRWLINLSVIVLVASALFRLGNFSWRQNLFLLSYFLSLLFLSPLVIGGPSVHHLLPLIPLLVIIIVLAIVNFVDIFCKSLNKKMRTLLFVIIIVILRVIDPPMMQSYIKTMKGVNYYCTDAVYSLTDWLLKNNLAGPAIIEESLAIELAYFTSKKIIYDDYTHQKERWKELGKHAYLFAYKTNLNARFDESKSMKLSDFNRTAKLIKTFNDSNGEEMIVVYEINDSVDGLMNFINKDPARPRYWYRVIYYK